MESNSQERQVTCLIPMSSNTITLSWWFSPNYWCLMFTLITCHLVINNGTAPYKPQASEFNDLVMIVINSLYLFKNSSFLLPHLFYESTQTCMSADTLLVYRDIQPQGSNSSFHFVSMQRQWPILFHLPETCLYLLILKVAVPLCFPAKCSGPHLTRLKSRQL